MSRKIRKVVASTLALAMMAGTAGSMPAGIINVSAADQVVSSANVADAIGKGPKVDAGKYTVKPGEQFDVKISISDNADGFMALNAWLDIDTNVFEIVGDVQKGDPSDPNNKKSNASKFSTTNLYHKDSAAAGVQTAIAMYSDTKNVTGDLVLATVTLKVKDSAKDGYYSLPFDAVAESGAMGNRLTDSKEIKIINPTYYGALVTVGNPSSDETQTPGTPATQNPGTPATQNPGTPATQNPGSSDSLTGKLADASGAVGTVSTTLTVSGADIAGFTADLGIDSGLELKSAKASGWEVKVNGKQLVALADPYKDNTSATVTLEFEAKSAGSYNVSVNSLTGASKDKVKEYKGTGSSAKITVTGGASSSDPTKAPDSQNQNSNGIKIGFEDTKVKAGETATINLTADNIGEGFSAVQFDYEMDKSFTFVDSYSDYGNWTIGEVERSLQFLQEKGNNVTSKGVIGEIDVEIPAGTPDGTYPIVIKAIEGSVYDSNAKKQIKLTSDKFTVVTGNIIVGEGGPTSNPTKAPSDPTDKPADPTKTPTQTPDNQNSNGIKIGFDKITAKPGDTVTINLNASNVGKGFSAMQFDYEMDKSFTFVDSYSDYGNWTIGEVERSLQFLQEKGNNVTEEGVIGEIDIKIPDDAKDGVYPIVIKNIEGSVYDESAKKQQKLTSSAFTVVEGSITIGNGASSDPTDKPADPTKTPAPSSVPTTVPTQGTQASQPVDKADIAGALDGPKVDAGKYKVKAGEEFNVQIKISDNEEGFMGLNAWLDIDTNKFEIVGDVQKGDPSDPNNKKSNASKFTTTNIYHKDSAPAGVQTAIAMYNDTKNVTGDLVLATITIKVKDDVKDGFYTFPFDAVAEKGAMGNRLGSDKEVKVINPTYYGALIQVGDVSDVTEPGTTPSTKPTDKPTDKPTSDPGKTDKMTVSFEDAKVKPGDTVTLNLKASNIGAGFSAMQFDYEMDKNLTFVDTYSDYGNWTIGEVERSLQFLQEKGNNVTEEGVIGEIDLKVPADMKPGKYTIELKNFAGSVYDEAAKKQQKLTAADFSTVTATITVEGEGSTDEDPGKSDGIKVAFEDASGKPGDTITLNLNATNIGKGFSAMQFDYEMDKNLTFVDTYSDYGNWTIGEVERSLQFLQEKGNNVTEEGVVGEIDLKIPADMKPGKYTITIKNIEGSVYDESAKKQQKLTSKDFTTAVATITVEGEGSDTPGDELNYDVNGDGTVNTADIVALKRFLLLADTKKPANGDISGDGNINSQDMVLLVKYILSK